MDLTFGTPLSQSRRLLQLTTPLGADQLQALRAHASSASASLSASPCSAMTAVRPNLRASHALPCGDCGTPVMHFEYQQLSPVPSERTRRKPQPDNSFLTMRKWSTPTPILRSASGCSATNR